MFVLPLLYTLTPVRYMSVLGTQKVRRFTFTGSLFIRSEYRSYRSGVARSKFHLTSLRLSAVSYTHLDV